MKPWLLGNTTVRSPFRLREGLVALSTSPLQGCLRGREQEKAFRQLLGERGIVELGEDKSYSVGRKWRSALSKLGFLCPKLVGRLAEYQDRLGPPDIITENGWRLVRAESVAGWQECFLRALAALFIPSALENGYDCRVFSPLRHILALMVELEKMTGENRLGIVEMSLIVQLTSSETPISDIARAVLDFRERRDAAERKREFDRDATNAAAAQYKMVASTFKDYADTNFRYLKATGLVQSKGRGIALVPEKRVLIERLIKDTRLPESDLDYLQMLCSGAILPTDEKDGALAVLYDLTNQLERRGHLYDLGAKKLDTPADIAVVRHEIEDLLAQLNELEYAAQQAELGEEISEFLGLLVNRRESKTLSNGNKIEIPKSEFPAYFEWTIWRAFLAINSLVNKPWEARCFKIDQDFLPVGTAPGNGPDMIFEFEDMILVVEVTLTSSSRQEAAEGEPVRRHVAKYAEEYTATGKPVFGLFLAVNIDTNTANTFRLGEWYLRDDRKIDLHIVPMALSDFRDILDATRENVSAVLPKLKELLRDCRMYSNKDAPEWKQKVTELAQGVAASLIRTND